MAQQAEKGPKKQDLAYEAIRDAIVTQELQPQQMIVESELCEKLGLSRTPIRGALQRLALEGFVEHIPDKGMFVSQISFTVLLEIAEARIPLECYAARLCCERMTEADLAGLQELYNTYIHACNDKDYHAAISNDNSFHLAIAAGCKNSRIEAMIRSLINQSMRVTYLTSKDPSRVQDASEQHTSILQAILAGDADQAEAAMGAHLEDWIHYIRSVMCQKYYLYK